MGKVWKFGLSTALVALAACTAQRPPPLQKTVPPVLKNGRGGGSGQAANVGPGQNADLAAVIQSSSLCLPLDKFLSTLAEEKIDTYNIWVADLDLGKLDLGNPKTTGTNFTEADETTRAKFLLQTAPSEDLPRTSRPALIETVEALSQSKLIDQSLLPENVQQDDCNTVTFAGDNGTFNVTGLPAKAVTKTGKPIPNGTPAKLMLLNPKTNEMRVYIAAADQLIVRTYIPTSVPMACSTGAQDLTILRTVVINFNTNAVTSFKLNPVFGQLLAKALKGVPAQFSAALQTSVPPKKDPNQAVPNRPPVTDGQIAVNYPTLAILSAAINSGSFQDIPCNK